VGWWPGLDKAGLMAGWTRWNRVRSLKSCSTGLLAWKVTFWRFWESS